MKLKKKNIFYFCLNLFYLLIDRDIFKEEMDENGLPITGAGVNYTSVEAINQRELITYFNMFLVRTCAFMNTFSTKCESKLANLHLRLENINTSLTLLEAKVN